MSQSADYASHLAHQHAVLGDFVETLAREQAILTGPPANLHALADVTETKRSQAATLETLEGQRRQLAAQSVQGAADEAQTATDAAMAEYAGCTDLWRAFVARVADARAQNENNGLAIGQRLDFTNRVLGFLRRSAGQSLYAADGRRAPLTRARIHRGA